MPDPHPGPHPTTPTLATPAPTPTGAATPAVPTPAAPTSGAPTSGAPTPSAPTTHLERVGHLDVEGIDRLIHEPARLAVLTVLTGAQSADFLFLQRATGLTKGNLSSHLAKLEAGGLVRIEKTFVGRRPRTRVELTAAGRAGVTEHWARLERLKDLAAPPAPG